jgi:hypothetical protein
MMGAVQGAGAADGADRLSELPTIEPPTIPEC